MKNEVLEKMKKYCKCLDEGIQKKDFNAITHAMKYLRFEYQWLKMIEEGVTNGHR